MKSEKKEWQINESLNEFKIVSTAIFHVNIFSAENTPVASVTPSAMVGSPYPPSSTEKSRSTQPTPHDDHVDSKQDKVRLFFWLATIHTIYKCLLHLEMVLDFVLLYHSLIHVQNVPI